MIQVPETLIKRNEERLERLLKKKEEAGEEENLNETFWDTFRSKLKEIESHLESVEGLEDKNELSEVFNKVSKLLQVLTRYLSSSTQFLTAFDHRTAKEMLRDLQEKFKETENKHIPKRKFGFNNLTPAKNNECSVRKNVTEVVVTPDSLSFEIGFDGKIGEVLTLTRDQLHGKDVVLDELRNCEVYLLGSCSTLQISRISGCRVCTGPISTSVFVDGCTASVVSVACQQLRIHRTTKTDFYVHVSAKAITEDSTDVRFAPYDFSYDGLQYDFKTCGLDPSANNWDDVDDFNWLVWNKKSPNWSIIPENERIKLTM